VAKILYVEDHPAQRDIMAQMLQLGGFEVQVAEDGLVGVEKATNWVPDIILMDLRMPRMDGFEAIKKIKSNPTTKKIPIIAISAWASGRHKKQALELGAQDHFTKPVDLGKLMTTINVYLKQPAR